MTATDVARGQTELPDRLARHVIVGVGADLVIPAGDFCSAGGDVVACTPGGYAGLEASAFYVPVRWVGVGGRALFAPDLGSGGTMDSSGGGSEVTRQRFQAAAQGRFHPLALGMAVPWVGLEIGLAAMRTRVVTTSPTLPDRASSDTESAEVFGAGAGLDGWIAERFALGAQFWVHRIGFYDSEARPPFEGSFYTSPIFYSLGLSLRVLI